MEWISVKDRLPETDDFVLVCRKKFATYALAFYMGKKRVMKSGWYIINQDNYAENIKFVTHWQPLPEPPKD